MLTDHANENGNFTFGGGIENAGTLTLVRSTLANNQGLSGGGLNNLLSGQATIIDSTLSSNSAGSGGGILNRGELTIVNSTLSGNAARDSGGGARHVSGTMSLTNVTITNNRADSDGNGLGGGGGLSAGNADVTLHNTIVADNYRGTGTTGDEVEGTLDPGSSFNLIGSFASNSSDSGGISPSNGNRFQADDLRLAPLADNGGPTPTHALRGGSPALDAGGNLPAVLANLAADQRGVNRFRDGGSGTSRVDIGAYEAVAAPTTFTVTTIEDEDDGGLASGVGNSLREVLRAANDNVGADTIEFSLPASSTITLTRGGLPTVAEDLTILGPGADQLQIAGGGERPAVMLSIGNVNLRPTVELAGLTLRGAETGIYNLGTLTVRDSVLTDHANENGNFTFGGGIENAGTLTLVRSTLANNQGLSGGGLNNLLSGQATIIDSTLSSNSAGSGGGILNRGELTIVNSTLSGNAARDSGGGARHVSGTMSLTNVTITNNRADSDGNGLGGGGGLSAGNVDVTLHNTIVADNYRGTGTTGDEVEGTLDPGSSFNLIGSFASNSSDSGGISPSNGNRFQADDLRLAPLADNGGPTPTHALRGGSPAIEAGSSLRGRSGRHTAVERPARRRLSPQDRRGRRYRRLRGCRREPDDLYRDHRAGRRRWPTGAGRGQFAA